jgi:LPXTG-motif cell wall-anchored protein
MNTGDYMASNNLFILIAVVLIAIGSLAWFMRKRSNRHPMDTPRGHEIEEQRRRETLAARDNVIDPPPTRQ